VEWKDRREGLVHVALRVNGVTVACAPAVGTRRELESGRAVLPSDHVDVVAFDSTGRRIRGFHWGEPDRLPATWDRK
jgi:hypothetical protein